MSQKVHLEFGAPEAQQEQWEQYAVVDAQQPMAHAIDEQGYNDHLAAGGAGFLMEYDEACPRPEDPTSFSSEHVVRYFIIAPGHMEIRFVEQQEADSYASAGMPQARDVRVVGYSGPAGKIVLDMDGTDGADLAAQMRGFIAGLTGEHVPEEGENANSLVPLMSKVSGAVNREVRQIANMDWDIGPGGGFNLRECGELAEGQMTVDVFGVSYGVFDRYGTPVVNVVEVPEDE